MYIYRFYNQKNEVIYVGQTVYLEARIRAHMLQEPWASEVNRITFARCRSKTDLDTYELLYINSDKPKYNRRLLKPPLNFVDYRIDQMKIKSASKPKRTNRLSALEPRQNDVFIGIEGKIPLLDFQKSKEDPCTSIRYYVGPLDYFFIETTCDISEFLKRLIKLLILRGSTTYEPDCVDFKASFDQLGKWLRLPPGQCDQLINPSLNICLCRKNPKSSGTKPLLISWEIFEEHIIMTLINLTMIRQRIMLPGNAII